MTEQSKDEKLTGPDLLARALEKRGIKVRQVPTPKGFVRVIFPRNPPGFADGSNPDERKS